MTISKIIRLILFLVSIHILQCDKKILAISIKLNIGDKDYILLILCDHPIYCFCFDGLIDGILMMNEFINAAVDDDYCLRNFFSLSDGCS